MALIAGIGLFAISSKERGENGEWHDGLQWGYLRRDVAVAQTVFQTRADDHGG